MMRNLCAGAVLLACSCYVQAFRPSGVPRVPKPRAGYATSTSYSGTSRATGARLHVRRRIAAVSPTSGIWKTTAAPASATPAFATHPLQRKETDRSKGSMSTASAVTAWEDLEGREDTAAIFYDGQVGSIHQRKLSESHDTISAGVHETLRAALIAVAAGILSALTLMLYVLVSPAQALAAGDAQGVPGSGPGCTMSTNPSYSMVSCDRTGLDRDGRLLGCSSSENCLSTSAVKIPGKLGSPWEYARQTDDADRAFASLVRAVEATADVTMETVDTKGHYLLAQFPSKVPPGSVDSVEFLVKPADQIVLYRYSEKPWMGHVHIPGRMRLANIWGSKLCADLNEHAIHRALEEQKVLHIGRVGSGPSRVCHTVVQIARTFRVNERRDGGVQSI